MAVINLREIALKIVSASDFSDDAEGMNDALNACRKALTPEGWRKATNVLMCGFLLDVRAEYERDLPVVRHRTPDPQPSRVGGIRFVEGAVEPEPVAESDDVPVVALRHSSESENWPTTPAPGKTSGLEHPPAPPKRRTPWAPTPKFGPVVRSHVSDRVSEPEPQAVLTAVRPTPAAEPVHVQQDGWKVPALRNMKVFPSLANQVTINGVRMREGEMTKAQIPFRRDQIAAQRRVLRDRDTHQQARIDRRNDLNRQDEAEMRVRRAQDGQLQAEDDRLTAVEPVLAERPDGTAITELDTDVLVGCGYERRSA